MSIAAIIKTVAPAGAATKWVEAHLECSPRQAKRIVSEGRIPLRLYGAVLTILEGELKLRRAQFDEIEGQIRDVRRGLMVARAEARRAAMLDPTAELGGRQDEGAAASLPLNMEGGR